MKFFPAIEKIPNRTLRNEGSSYAKPLHRLLSAIDLVKRTTVVRFHKPGLTTGGTKMSFNHFFQVSAFPQGVYVACHLIELQPCKVYLLLTQLNAIRMKKAKPLVLFMLILAVTASCKKEEMPDPGAMKKGFLNIQIGLFIHVNDISNALKSTGDAGDLRVEICRTDGTAGNDLRTGIRYARYRGAGCRCIIMWWPIQTTACRRHLIIRIITAVPSTSPWLKMPCRAWS